MVNLSRESHLGSNKDPQKQEVIYAGFWQRFFAIMLDGILLGILMIILGKIYSFLPNISSVDTDSGLDTNNSQVSSILSILISISITAVFIGLFLSSNWQATPGKRLMNIYVTNVNVYRLTFIKAFFRNIVKNSPYILLITLPFFIDFSYFEQLTTVEDPINFDYEEYLNNLPDGAIKAIMISALSYLSILIVMLVWYLVAVFTKQKTAIHDIICGTRVIKGRP